MDKQFCMCDRVNSICWFIGIVTNKPQNGISFGADWAIVWKKLTKISNYFTFGLVLKTVKIYTCNFEMFYLKI